MPRSEASARSAAARVSTTRWPRAPDGQLVSVVGWVRARQTLGNLVDGRPCRRPSQSGRLTAAQGKLAEGEAVAVVEAEAAPEDAL